MIRLLYNNDSQKADLVRDGYSILTEDTFETAVLISLFSRRRANPDDTLPDPAGHYEGWWADRHPDVEGDLLGSRLWLLSRSKTTQSTLNQAAVYAKEALQWMLDDGIAESVEVEVERYKGEILAFKPMILRNSDPATPWARFWTAHLAML